MTIDELGRRFTVHQNIALSISKLIPSFIADTQFSDVLTIFNHYKDDLQSDDGSVHKAEFDTWKFSILRIEENKRLNTINETLKMIQPIKAFFVMYLHTNYETFTEPLPGDPLQYLNEAV